MRHCTPSSFAGTFAVLVLGTLLLPLCACSDSIAAPFDPGTLRVDLVTPEPVGVVRCGQEIVITAKATQSNGKGAVAGVLLNFNVTAGGGGIFGGAALTNDKGLASDIWTLGLPDTPNTIAVRSVNAAGTGTTYATMSLTPLGKIVFEKGLDIWITNSDGSEPTNLTGAFLNFPPREQEPSLSPDGSKIAYAGYHQTTGNSGIWVMDADGRNAGLVSPGYMKAHPAWSPDGRKIAFDLNGKIYVIDANGSNERQLTDAAATDQGPAWSPDGSKIVFSRNAGGDTELYVLSVDGTGLPRNLTNHAGADLWPAWSPDGSKIAFTSTRDAGDLEIYVMNADGSAQINLTNRSGFDAFPFWSPDGSRIAYSRSGASSADLYVMSATGASPTKLIPNVYTFGSWVAACPAR